MLLVPALRPVSIGLAAIAAATLCAAAQAQKTYTFVGPGVTIPDSGAASAYPATLTVTGMTSSMAEVKVRLNGLTHTYLEDLQVLLVAPDGTRTLLMDRVGGYDPVVNADYLFVTGGAFFPYDYPPASGRYAPADNPTNNQNLLAPAPAGPYVASMDPFVDHGPNGVWSLYVCDRAGGDSGTLAGWSVVITETDSIVNPAYVDIPSLGAANPYPSVVVVDGLSGKVANIEVMLRNLSHQWMYDLEALLVSPTGQTCLLTADCGGEHRTNLDLLFSDLAAEQLQWGVAANSGTYRPSQCAGTSFPAPAPAPPYGTTLSVFNGGDPNGVWRLYINDDSGSDLGHMDNGWALIVNGQVCPGDFNRSGAITVQDIFDFLTAYFAACP